MMFKSLMLPLGFVLSYATFSELLWKTNHSLSLTRALLENNAFIAFLQGLLSAKGVGKPLTQTTIEVVALVNVEMVFHALAIGFFFAWALVLLIEWFIYGLKVTVGDIPPMISGYFLSIANRRDISVNQKYVPIFEASIALILTFWILHLVLNIFHLAGSPASGAYASWGDQLLRYADFIEDFFSIVTLQLTR